MTSEQPTYARFWSKVDKRGPDECWEWVGTRHATGYGYFRVGNKHRRAHRVAWELTSGPIPDGHRVLHRCDNPSCVNPDHLWVGTHTDNMRDKVEKGRARWRNVLDDAQVQEIIAAYPGRTQAALASEFGVSESTIRRALRRIVGPWEKVEL